MKRLCEFVFVAALLLLSQAQSISAVPIALPVGGGWQRFYWNDVPGPTFEPNDLSEDGYLLTTSRDVYVNVTDAFRPGDYFQVFVNGVLRISTPVVPQTNLLVNNPDAAFGNPNFSWAQFTLPPGTYVITVFISGGLRSGSGFVQAVPTPEPLTLLLLSTGLTACAAEVRRRHRRVADADDIG